MKSRLLLALLLPILSACPSQDGNQNPGSVQTDEPGDAPALPNVSELTFDITETAVTATWTPPESEKTLRFRVSVSEGNQAPPNCTNPRVETGESNATVAGLLPNTLYALRVCLMTTQVQSDRSEMVSVSEGTTGSVRTRVHTPGEVSGLSLTQPTPGEGEIHVSWTESANAEYYLLVDRSTAPAVECTDPEAQRVDQTFFRLRNLEVYEKRFIRVCAVNSNAATSTTDGILGEIVVAGHSPSNVSGVSVSRTTNSAHLTWTAGTFQNASFRVAINTSQIPTSCDDGTVYTIDGNAGELQIEALGHGTHVSEQPRVYRYRICSVSTGGAPSLSHGVSGAFRLIPPKPAFIMCDNSQGTVVFSSAFSHLDVKVINSGSTAGRARAHAPSFSPSTLPSNGSQSFTFCDYVTYDSNNNEICHSSGYPSASIDFIVEIRATDNIQNSEPLRIRVFSPWSSGSTIHPGSCTQL